MNKFSIDFVKQHKGYRIVCVLTEMGHRCGYIEIPKNHKYFKKDYDDIDIDCHGDLTFSEYCNDYPITTKEKVYWIGFDCMHPGDGNNSITGKIQTKQFVLNECKDIVEQLIKV